MKKIVRFSKGFLPAAIISFVLAAGGIAGYIVKDGFNLGVDFQAGLIQEVRFGPAALSLSWPGPGNAVVSLDNGVFYVVVSGAGVEGKSYPFPLDEYKTLGALAEALGQIEGLSVSPLADEGVNTQRLIQSAWGNSQLGSTPYILHYLVPDDEAAITIGDVRDALASLGRSVSVQQLGNLSDQHYLIRVIFESSGGEEAGGDSESGGSEETGGGEEAGGGAEGGGDKISFGQIMALLETAFGGENLIVIRSDEVAERFSKDLTNQAGRLLALTLALILIYASIRFKPQYAIGAVIAIIHDALIMVAFIVWTRMEFNTTTIAAILTILGYSINDTIVIFDRIRETRRIYPDDSFVDILNRALSETLGRTIITTLTTMLAVVSLYIFTSGSMKDFALALLVGMVSGVYSTIFIASGFVYFWDAQKTKRAKKRLAVPSAAKA
jgi:preprotein translocase subunit SecF